jgi:hypothetical protein
MIATVAAHASRKSPTPARAPTAAVDQIVAAVLSPEIFVPSRGITPPARNPTPLDGVRNHAIGTDSDRRLDRGKNRGARGHETGRMQAGQSSTPLTFKPDQHA